MEVATAASATQNDWGVRGVKWTVGDGPLRPHPSIRMRVDLPVFTAPVRREKSCHINSFGLRRSVSPSGWYEPVGTVCGLSLHPLPDGWLDTAGPADAGGAARS